MKCGLTMPATYTMMLPEARTIRDHLMSKRLHDDEVESLYAFLDEIGEASGAVIRPYFRQRIDVEDKAPSDSTKVDPVTIADREAEVVIRDMITDRYPKDAIFGEEFGHQAGTSGRSWIIDPIDGTRSFISGLPLWGTLVALTDDAGPLVGMMDQPILGERFLGDGDQAMLNGEVICTRDVAGLKEATLMCTDPEMFIIASERAAFDAVQDQVAMTRYSGDCYGYCMLADGFADILIEADLKAYDIQALIPIVEGAGGLITNWQGGAIKEGGRVVAAGCATVHAEALKILSAVPD